MKTLEPTQTQTGGSQQDAQSPGRTAQTPVCGGGRWLWCR